MKQMNLLDWNPLCQVIAFPLINRVWQDPRGGGKTQREELGRCELL
jgi:hypothetical protein